MASRVVIGYDGSAASGTRSAFGLTWCRSAGDVPIVATVYPEEHPFAIGRVDVEWATYTVLGQSSERYSRLVGRTDEHAFLDKAATHSAKRWSLLRLGYRQSSSRRRPSSRERSWSRWLRWAPTMSTSSFVAPEAMAQRAGSCSVESRRG